MKKMVYIPLRKMMQVPAFRYKKKLIIHYPIDRKDIGLLYACIEDDAPFWSTERAQIHRRKHNTYPQFAYKASKEPSAKVLSYSKEGFAKIAFYHFKEKNLKNYLSCLQNAMMHRKEIPEQYLPIRSEKERAFTKRVASRNQTYQT